MMSPLTRVARSTSGLWLDRHVFKTQRTQVRIEIPLPDGPYFPASSFLTTLACLSERVSPSTREWLVLPDVKEVRDAGVFRYVLPRQAEMLYDRVERDLPIAAFALIGTRLAELHRTAIDRLRLARQPAIDVLTPTLTKQTGVAGEFLIRSLGVCPGLAGILQRQPKGRRRRAVMLHGRWSLGALYLDRRNNVLAVSGLDHWLGPAEFDLGYLLGELLELGIEARITGRGASPTAVEGAAQALVRGYRQTRDFDKGQTLRQTARRICSHLMLNAMWRSRHSHPALTLRQFVEFCTASEQALTALEESV